MEMSFRWYGEDDPVTLEKIRQIPDMKGIVTAIYDIPPGETWPYEDIVELKNSVEEAGLKLTVIESVPVHEEIKLGSNRRDVLIDQFAQTIRNLSKAGINTVCYNFMPVFDWVRTDLAAALPDGSNSLYYSDETVRSLNPVKGEFSLPGWDLSYQKEDLETLLKDYSSVTEEQLMENLIYFLKKIIPVAEEKNVNMALHPDDPPWPVFGLPRIVNNVHHVRTILSSVESKNNGITFCTGSFGADRGNNLEQIIETAEGRIHFVHARNITWTGSKSFQETSHSVKDGSINMVSVMNKLLDKGFKGAIRPDHGRMIWGESGRPGYGLYDRALGAAYLNGIIDSYQERKVRTNDTAAIYR
ncbi:mannonate dehydratase [Alteribacter keqinensis]|uniref:Mannonate dehydratase n=1 Tax=Alteribacter keqinensis TaxID=2483800 RepID=A0A3M7TNG5_9BACI|nr:mannonate dehydratase [Alteribacter keqinensis]RNA67173.1 mannonate dehydratase [Alteribacter keqinensis]